MTRSDILGWVIVRVSDGWMFAGYRHPGTKKIGFPMFVFKLENTNFDGRKASIWREAKEAVDVANSIFSREQIHCSVRPLYMGYEAPPQR